ncbi:hypothetical protein BDW22DRAFT_1428833 [Trametopsis cervina]|nr:hypothetical protein BDW22DRAFT_1428833 [Trametopsis cervina]
MDDGHPNITYSAGWDTSPNGLEGSYYNSTMHRTNTQGASATISFEGNSITVYGATSYDHALFSVQLDGGDPMLLNGTAPVPRYQNMLYYAGGLANTSHVLDVANVDTTGMWLDLDKVVVSKWGTWNTSEGLSGGGQGGSSPDGSHPAPVANHSHVPVGSIVGVVIGGIALFVLAALGLFLFLRRRGHARHRAGINRIDTVAPSSSARSSSAASEKYALAHLPANAYTGLPPPNYMDATISRTVPYLGAGEAAP